MIRIVFFDIDGTILSHKRNAIPASTIYAFQELRRKNILLAGCTGRHPLELNRLPVQEFPADAWIYLNGSYCTKGQESVAERNLSKACMRKLQQWLVKHPVPVQIMERDYIYDTMVSETMRRELALVHTLPDPVEPLTRLTQHPVLMVIPWASVQVRQEISSMLDLKEAPWGSASDMIVKDSGKDAGVRDILQAYGLKKEEAMCFGDGKNDVAMFDACGTSICMGNGCAEAKARADEICEDIDADGIYHTLVRHGLIEKKDGFSHH